MMCATHSVKYINLAKPSVVANHFDSHRLHFFFFLGPLFLGGVFFSFFFFSSNTIFHAGNGLTTLPHRKQQKTVI